MTDKGREREGEREGMEREREGEREGKVGTGDKIDSTKKTCMMMMMTKR